MLKTFDDIWKKYALELKDANQRLELLQQSQETIDELREELQTLKTTPIQNIN